MYVPLKVDSFAKWAPYCYQNYVAQNLYDLRFFSKLKSVRYINTLFVGFHLLF